MRRACVVAWIAATACGRTLVYEPQPQQPLHPSRTPQSCGSSSNCDDGVDCTVDVCDLDAGACVWIPVDARCPTGELCGSDGCGVFAYAVSNRTLFDVRLPLGMATPLGDTLLPGHPTPTELDDIALDSSGVLYGIGGVSFGARRLGTATLFSVDRLTAQLTPLSSGLAVMNALDVLPGGELYGGGGSTIYSVDRASGAQQPVASLPPPLSVSGDLAVVSGHIFVTAVNANDPHANDGLVEVVTDGGATRFIGDTGTQCLWGLAAYGPQLYGFSCDGGVYSVDVATGAATGLSAGGASYFGASAR
jgi:hypothetical protein